jgi:hypothetical protein
MTDVKSAWNDAGERLGGLGRRLKGHYEVKRGDDPEQVGAELKEAVKKLSVAVQDAFEAVGAAAKDQAVKDDVRQVGQSLTVALGATFTEISEDLRKALKRSSAEQGSAPGNGGEPGAQPGTEPGKQTGKQDEPGVEPWGTP